MKSVLLLSMPAAASRAKGFWIDEECGVHRAGLAQAN